MNAETKVEKKNLRIWNAVSKTDPAHTKGFSRAGGFKGTAIKPMWIVKMLTEQFGPCGKGWGIDEPNFHVVPTGDEVLVFCTVRCWYDDSGGSGIHQLHGVGGDKAMVKRQSGAFCDDEAFKKAFTDAVGNAFKFIGVGADVHMGLFDDSKYVAAVRAEFESNGEVLEGERPPGNQPAPREKLDGPHTSKTALRTAVNGIVSKVRAAESDSEITAILEENKKTVNQARRDWPDLIDGDPRIPEDGGLRGAVEQARALVAEDGQLTIMIRSMKECDTKLKLTNWRAANEDMIEALDGVESRRFQLAWDMHESAVNLMDTARA